MDKITAFFGGGEEKAKEQADTKTAADSKDKEIPKWWERLVRIDDDADSGKKDKTEAAGEKPGKKEEEMNSPQNEKDDSAGQKDDEKADLQQKKTQRTDPKEQSSVRFGRNPVAALDPKEARIVLLMAFREALS